MNVVRPFDGDFAALRRKLALWGFDVGERPNAPVFARGPGVSIHAYATGKLLFTGPRAQEWAEAYDEGAPPRAQARPAPPLPPGWVLSFDGLCMPRNPGGVAAYGYQVLREGRVVHEGHGLAAPPGPLATNNVAEFTALVEGLRWLRGRASPGEPVLVRGDSRLVVETLAGTWKLKAEHLRPLHAEAARLLRELGARLEWVPREENEEADRLSRVGYEEAVRAHPEWARR